MWEVCEKKSDAKLQVSFLYRSTVRVIFGFNNSREMTTLGLELQNPEIVCKVLV